MDVLSIDPSHRPDLHALGSLHISYSPSFAFAATLEISLAAIIFRNVLRLVTGQT